MQRIVLFLAICLGFFSALNALPPLPSCYHTYDQVTTELQQMEDQYPGIAKVYNIGHTENDSLPIYAMKISDNVNLEEQEPAVVFIGQVHAEEVIGVETTLSNIHEILSNNQTPPYGNWINRLEMWFIPTLNPEGHNVVTADLDPSYRKNKHDNNHNGVFDFSPLVGYDIDGVDINRNFAFNWCHGDTLFQPGGTEIWDYYRGPYPMSESEVQGFASFCRVHKPAFCIVWHSSRSGSLSEKVFYPLNWYSVRPCPDLALGQQIGEGVAASIIKENGASGYEPSPSLGRTGDANNWLYQQFGTMVLVIECATSNLQPDSLLMVDTVQRCSNGVKWMLNRALPISTAVPSNSLLLGTVTDAVTHQPLEADIQILEKTTPWFAPRLSDPVTGYYFRPISGGTYTARITKKGYAPLTVSGINVYTSWMTRDFALTPLSAITLSGTVKNSSGNLIPARIILSDIVNDTLQTSGEFSFTTYRGEHRIEITAEGYYPFVDTLEISNDNSNLHLYIVLTPAQPVFTETWENGLGNWVKNSHWSTENILAVSGYALADSWGGRGFYAQNCNVWIRTSNPIAIPSSTNPLLIFDENLYTEFVYDSVRVEVSADTLHWQTIYSNSGQKDYWHAVYIPLSQFGGQSLYFRLRLTDQSTDFDLTDPGWTVDNFRIVTGSATADSDETNPLAPLVILYPNYPNPFGHETTIKFSLSKSSQVSLAIYNVKGEKVRTISSQPYQKGSYDLAWNSRDDAGKAVASGIYFYRLKVAGKTLTRKMVLMK